jgi:hypothetical protein
VARQSLTIVLPDKAFRVTPSWVLGRDAQIVRIWASAGDHRKGAKAAVHSQHFADEDDARGALHLLSEAALYAHACGNGRVDLRDFCFWGDAEGKDDSLGDPRAEVDVGKPPPGSITLSSLFTRNRT